MCRHDERPVHAVERDADAGIARDDRAGRVVGENVLDARGARKRAFGQRIGDALDVVEVDRADAAVEELVLPDRLVGHRGCPENRHRGVRPDCTVDPVRATGPDPGPELAERGLVDAVAAVLDDVGRQHEVGRDERR